MTAIAAFFSSYCEGLSQALKSVPLDRFEQMVCLLESAYHDERHIFVMGNGGSASTASHLVCDINKGVSFGLAKRFRTICLSDNVATLTAYANDISYEDVFVEPLKNFLRDGDVVIGVSGSGNSRNVIKAVEYANAQGAHTVGLLGYDGGQLAKLVQTSLVVPVDDMQKAEDAHFILCHVLMRVLHQHLHPNVSTASGSADA